MQRVIQFIILTLVLTACQTGHATKAFPSVSVSPDTKATLIAVNAIDPPLKRAETVAATMPSSALHSALTDTRTAQVNAVAAATVAVGTAGRDDQTDAANAKIIADQAKQIVALKAHEETVLMWLRIAIAIGGALGAAAAIYFVHNVTLAFAIGVGSVVSIAALAALGWLDSHLWQVMAGMMGLTVIYVLAATIYNAIVKYNLNFWQAFLAAIKTPPWDEFSAVKLPVVPPIVTGGVPTSPPVTPLGGA